MANPSNSIEPLTRIQALGLGAGLGGAGALWILSTLPLDGLIKRELHLIAGTALVGALGMILFNESLRSKAPLPASIYKNKADALWTEQVTDNSTQNVIGTAR